MATIVEKFVVALGLDAKGFNEGLNQTAKNINEAQRATNKTENTINQSVASHAKATKEGLNETSKASAKLQQSLSETSKSFDNLSTQWLARVKVLATGLIAPVAMMFSVGKAFNNYFSETAQVAKMTGQHSEKLEEWRKKRAMLNRVTQEDIHLYKKSRESLLSFNIVMGDLGAMITRAQAPAIKFLLGLLDKFTKWVDTNKVNIVRFIKVLTTSILVMLIPAFVKLGIAMIANPITLIIALIGSLIFIIDDLVTYLHGGRSAFGDFWKDATPYALAFLDICKKVYKAFIDLQVLNKILDYLKIGLNLITSALKGVINVFRLLFGIVTGDIELIKSSLNNLFDAFKGFWGSIGQIFVNAFKNAIEVLSYVSDDFNKFKLKVLSVVDSSINAIKSFISYLKNVGNAIKNAFDFSFIVESFKSVGNAIKNAFDLTAITNGLKNSIASLLDNIPDFLKTDSMKEFIINTKQVNDNANQADILTTTNQSNINNSNKSMTQNNNITINAQTNDPQGVANAVQQAQQGYNYDDLVYSSANGQTL